MNATPTSDGRGHKRRAAREQARERILAAARQAFSERGYAATSLDRVTSAAGCTKGLVHHYFGSKRRLWDAVIDQYAEGARARPGAGNCADGLDAVMQHVEGSFRFFRRYPDYLRFEAWAELESGAQVPESLREIAAELKALIEQAQRSGSVRRDVDAHHLLAMLHSLVAGWFKSRRFFCAMWGRSPADRRIDDAYFADLVRVLRRGLAPDDGVEAATRAGRKRRDQHERG